MADEPALPDSVVNDKYRLIWLNIFWPGLLIYIAGFALSITDQVNHRITVLIEITGLIMFLPAVSFLIGSKIKNLYLRVFFFIYCFWSISLLIRGFEFDYYRITFMLFYPNYGFLVYFIPFVLLIPNDALYLKKAFNAITIFSILYLLFVIAFLDVLLAPFMGNMHSQLVVENFSNHLSLSCGFLLFTYIYHSKKQNLFALFILFLTFLLAAIRARRGMMFMSFSMLIVTYVIYQYANKTKIINIVLSLFLVSTISYVATNIYLKNRNDTFGLITQRFSDDSRTLVETYFFKGMTTKDWIIGKGYNGQYYCPMWDETTGIPSIYRDVIETGYLQTILNGGVVSLGLFLLIAIPAIFKGLFYSRNILSKAAAIWIFLFLVYNYPATPTAFSLFYILVWISIGICYSDELRSMPEDTLKEQLLKK